MNPQWIGTPITCVGSPSTVIGRMRLVTYALHTTTPRLEDRRTQPPCSMPFSFARASPISMNSSGCRIALMQRVLGPEVEMLGQAVGRGDIRKLRRSAECRPVVGEHPRRRVRLDLGMQDIRHRRFETARSAPGTDLPTIWSRANRRPSPSVIHDERTDPSEGFVVGP